MRPALTLLLAAGVLLTGCGGGQRARTARNERAKRHAGRDQLRIPDDFDLLVGRVTPTHPQTG